MRRNIIGPAAGVLASVGVLAAGAPAALANAPVGEATALGPATAAFAASATPAGVTFTDLEGDGATVTLSSSTYKPGATVEVRGAGFVGENGQGGQDVVFKGDDDAWMAPAYGGSDAIHPSAAGTRPTFVSAADGSFSGWIKLPAKLALTSGCAGRHWLRALAGTFGNEGDPHSVPAFFSVTKSGTAQPLVTLAKPTAAAGAKLSVSGCDFTAGTTVTVALGHKPLNGQKLKVDESGAISGKLKLPAGAHRGSDWLTFTDRDTESQVKLTVTGTAKATR